MIRLIAIAGFLSACGVAETGLLLTVPSTSKDGGTGDIQIDIPENFGRAPVGGTYRQTYRITNNRKSSVNVQLLRIEGSRAIFGLEDFVENQVRTLTPGLQIEGTIVYVPRGGAESATFVFNVGERTVSGFGVEEAFRCEGGDVGAVPVGECLFATVTCTNDTDYEVFFDGQGWSGSPAFVFIPAIRSNVPPEERLFLDVQFCPQQDGKHSAALDLFAAVPDGRNITTYDLEGDGIFAGGALTCSPNPLFVGPVPVGGSYSYFVNCTTDKEEAILSLDLEIGAMNGFTMRLLVNGGIVFPPVSVTPNDFIQVEIIFSPPFAGDFRDALEIFTDNGSVRVDIIGSAFDENNCQLAFDQFLDFGVVPVGQAQTGELDITNFGSGICTLEPIGIAPGSDPAFTFSDISGMIGPGGAITFYGEFTPSRAGLHSGILLFNVVELGELQVNLSGSGLGISGGYTITVVPNSALSPAGGTPLAFSDDDDGFTTVGIGFPFEFDAQLVTDAFISTNGVISFAGSNGLLSFINESIPFAQDPNAFIAWWWDDLQTDPPQGPPSMITTALSGMPGMQVRSFSFVNVAAFGNNTPIVSAEVRLFEGSNEIEVHYGPITLRGVDFNGSAGWESFDGVDGADALGCSPNCTSADWPADTILRYVPTP